MASLARRVGRTLALCTPLLLFACPKEPLVGARDIECKVQDDCAADEACVNNQCRASCRVDAQCPADQACSEGVCLDGAGECTTSADCGGDGCVQEPLCEGGRCIGGVPSGGTCQLDSDCCAGHCDGGLCCSAGDCCATVTDCPISYIGVAACTDPATCQGGRRDPACVDNTCVSLLIEDDSACDAAVVADTCGAQPDQVCTGNVDQDAPLCPSEGEDGSACATPADCQSNHCQNGFCCTGGDCCNAPTDCPAAYLLEPVCDAAATCQGHREDATCVLHSCASSVVDDDSGCAAGDLADPCGIDADVFCSGDPVQQASGCVADRLLVHTANARTFRLSWTAGYGNDGLCDVQVSADGVTWSAIPGATGNCDADTTNLEVTLPSPFHATWDQTAVRLVRAGTNVSRGTFTEKLRCSVIGGSDSIPTPAIDEDCDGAWDNTTTGDAQCNGGTHPSSTPGAAYSCPDADTCLRYGQNFPATFDAASFGVLKGSEYDSPTCTLADQVWQVLIYEPGPQNGTVPSCSTVAYPGVCLDTVADCAVDPRLADHWYDLYASTTWHYADCNYTYQFPVYH